MFYERVTKVTQDWLNTLRNNASRKDFVVGSMCAKMGLALATAERAQKSDDLKTIQEDLERIIKILEK